MNSAKVLNKHAIHSVFACPVWTSKIQSGVLAGWRRRLIRSNPEVASSSVIDRGMLPSHPPSPINIEEEGHRDLEATPPRSTTNSTEDVAPLPASTPHPPQVCKIQQASRRRATGAGGGDIAEGHEFTGDEDGDAAQQARLHMHVAIDVAALQQAAALTGDDAPTESVSCSRTYI